MTVRAIVVDDEPLVRRGIVSRLAKFPGVDVVAQCGNGRDALNALRAHRPELLFLDVQMPGLDGFDVVASLGEGECPHVIFVTAHDTHAVRAFAVHALDYLLKPIDDVRFAEAVRRAIEAIARDREGDVGRRVAAVVGEMLNIPGDRAPRALANCFVVRSRGKVSFVRHADVDWIEADGDYVRLHGGAQTWLVRETMAAVDRRLRGRRFLRIHRSVIVNVDRIRELRSLDNGDYRVFLNDATELRMSRTHRDAVTLLTRGA
ncbi:MAG: response regulator transcription factor [Acidobacteriota bacterium]